MGLIGRFLPLAFAIATFVLLVIALCSPWFTVGSVEFWSDGTGRYQGSSYQISNSYPNLAKIYTATLALTIIAAIFAGFWVVFAFFLAWKKKEARKEVRFTSATLSCLFALIVTLLFSIGTAEDKENNLFGTYQPFPGFWGSNRNPPYGPSAGWYLTLIATVVSGVGVALHKEGCF